MLPRIECSGCGLCRTVCTSCAIQMIADDKGFLYPSVDRSLCTACRCCEHVCPVMTTPGVSEKTAIVAGYAKDVKLLKTSSSGAVFPILASEIIRRDGIVFGAAFGTGFSVEHKSAERPEELSMLCGSKYVQSDVGNCYRRAQEELLKGRWVYFSGTPCQIAALRNYLGRDYGTLILQDIVCHSVPSPKVWKSYVGELEQQYGGKICSISFRNKDSGWEHYQFQAKFDDGRTFSQPASENPFQKGFIKGLYSRPSCFTCKFKGIERCGDITLADFWGAKDTMMGAYNPDGTSMVMIHSAKGQSLFDSVCDALEVCPIDVEKAVMFNEAAVRPMGRPKRYEEFYDRYGKVPFSDLVGQCCELTTAERLVNKWESTLIGRGFRRFQRMIHRE